MRAPTTWASLVAIAAMTTACGRGCGSAPQAPQGMETTTEAIPAVAAPTSASPTAAESAANGAAANGAATIGAAPAGPIARDVAGALGLDLPDRRNDAVLPALDTLPRRRLRQFEIDRQLIVRVDATTLRVLDTTLEVKALVEDEAIVAALRKATQDWGVRSGVAATRLVLAFDRRVDRELAARVRRIAHAASSWRVVAIAVEGDDLYEVMLDPPPGRRP